ncbi:MAG: BamA/TamA family outer membrane protein [Saonia sp.]
MAKIGLLLLCIIIASCNTLKRVGEDELLLIKNHIYADDEKVVGENLQSLIIQKPNSTLLGYPLRLNLYNLAKKNPDSSFQAWLHRKEKREQRYVNLLSRKQLNRLGESFFVKGASEWLKKIGEAPVIIDTSKTIKSLERLKSYYGSKGYFNNNATYTVETGKRKQRAEINYKIILGKPFIIDSISKKIDSKAVDSIYELHLEDSFIKTEKQFDLSDFNSERERLTSLFRNSGVYNFQESSINYEILRDTTKIRDDQKMDVELNIDDLRQRDGGTFTTSEYKVHRFDQINIFADYTYVNSGDELQSIDYENYTIYYNDKLRYKPKALTDAIFLEKDSIYRDLDRLRTYRQITNLNTFKYPNIEFIEDSTGTKLTSNIYLAPRKKYSLGMNFDISHSNIQRLGVGFSTSLITRNVFGGAETLSVSAGGTFGLLSDDSLPEDFFSEIGGDINLTFPRIWFPLLNTKKIIPYYMLPQTRMSIGTSFQENIGLDRQTFNTILSYNWSPTDFIKNALELLNIQFVRNINPNRFFNVYQNTYERLDEIADEFQDNVDLAPFFEETNVPDNPRLIIPDGTDGFINAVEEGTVTNDEDIIRDVRSIEERRERLTENNLIFTSSYTYSRNNRTGINDNSFYQFRLKLESAGNLLSGISEIIPFNESDSGDLLVFGVPFSQYVKSEIDYIKHWNVSRTDVLAFRSFVGLAVPYGNSDNIPFVRSYFAGGSNDNRAWNPYSLGPGRTNNLNDFNEANFKLAFNLEYRFPIVGDIKGALFADAGNIWNVFDDIDDADATFNGFSSFADLALGTGFGLRYDFTYFVFRLDTGFKTYNPALEPSKRWFRDYNFANAVLNIGINYPF